MTSHDISIPIAAPFIGEEEKRAVLDVLDSGQLASGPRTRDFEEAVAAAAGSTHAVAVVNGTAALHLALETAGVGPGDEVAVPAFTFIATANAVLMAGAKPVLIDVDPSTFTMDPHKLEAVAHRLKAVMPVHLYGHPADMDALRDVAGDAVIIGDAAQAIGAAYKGKPVGSTALAEGFSFYPTKNVTSGEGGVITTDDDVLADLARSLRNHGRGVSQLGTYDHVRFGWNLRMTDLCAAVGLVQVKRLETITNARRTNARRLSEALSGIDSVVLPREEEHVRHAYHQYTIRVLGGPQRRDDLQAFLGARGIGTGVYYPQPLHGYRHLQQYGHSDLAVSEALSQDVLSLPVHPAVTDADIAVIADAVRDWTRSTGGNLS